MVVGRSGVTPYKQKCFQHITRENLQKTKCVWNKHDFQNEKRIYYLFDLTAGNADPAEKNSPNVLLNELYAQDGLNFRLHLIEKCKKDFTLLKTNVLNWIHRIADPAEREYFENYVHFHYGAFQDNLRELKSVNKWRFGIAYFDSNGCGGPEEWNFLSKVSRNWPQLELLINMDINALKRCYTSPHPHHAGHKVSIKDLLKSWNKKLWYVRAEKIDTKYWRMFFGTNMTNYHLTHLDFIRIDDIDNSPTLDDMDNFIHNK